MANAISGREDFLPKLEESESKLCLHCGRSHDTIKHAQKTLFVRDHAFAWQERCHSADCGVHLGARGDRADELLNAGAGVSLLFRDDQAHVLQQADSLVMDERLRCNVVGNSLMNFGLQHFANHASAGFR